MINLDNDATLGNYRFNSRVIVPTAFKSVDRRIDVSPAPMIFFLTSPSLFKNELIKIMFPSFKKYFAAYYFDSKTIILTQKNLFVKQVEQMR